MSVIFVLYMSLKRVIRVPASKHLLRGLGVRVSAWRLLWLTFISPRDLVTKTAQVGSVLGCETIYGYRGLDHNVVLPAQDLMNSD